MKELGGSAKPQQVYEKIAVDLNLPDETVNKSYGKSGGNRFQNQVAFARNYLVYAGYIDKSVRGIWTLTESGN